MTSMKDSCPAFPEFDVEVHELDPLATSKITHG
jgi:hypothetical protein